MDGMHDPDGHYKSLASAVARSGPAAPKKANG